MAQYGRLRDLETSSPYRGGFPPELDLQMQGLEKVSPQEPLRSGSVPGLPQRLAEDSHRPSPKRLAGRRATPPAASFEGFGGGFGGPKDGVTTPRSKLRQGADWCAGGDFCGSDRGSSAPTASTSASPWGSPGGGSSGSFGIGSSPRSVGGFRSPSASPSAEVRHGDSDRTFGSGASLVEMPTSRCIAWAEAPPPPRYMDLLSTPRWGHGAVSAANPASEAAEEAAYEAKLESLFSAAAKEAAHLEAPRASDPDSWAREPAAGGVECGLLPPAEDVFCVVEEMRDQRHADVDRAAFDRRLAERLSLRGSLGRSGDAGRDTDFGGRCFEEVSRGSLEPCSSSILGGRREEEERRRSKDRLTPQVLREMERQRRLLEQQQQQQQRQRRRQQQQQQHPQSQSGSELENSWASWSDEISYVIWGSRGSDCRTSAGSDRKNRCSEDFKLMSAKTRQRWSLTPEIAEELGL